MKNLFFGLSCGKGLLESRGLDDAELGAAQASPRLYH
jgi:hypothetical protein